MTKEIPATVVCRYCASQGIQTHARKLTGKDALTVKPATTRYGCHNGHKFAVPNA